LTDKGKTDNKGVALGNEYLNRIDNERLMIGAVNFNDCHGVSIDREYIVWETRHINESETVSA
jgi:hypothetical protein